MTVWTLTESDGQTRLSWGRRSRSFPSEREALAFVRQNGDSSDRVVKVDEDGYQTPMTRRRWRKRGTDL